MSISWAARSVGTLPKAVNATAAVFRTGPKLIPLTIPPSGGRATVVVAHPQRRRGSRYSVRHGMIFTSQTLCPGRSRVGGTAQILAAATARGRRVDPQLLGRCGGRSGGRP